VRAIPGLAVCRPADANETAQAWKSILERFDEPVGLVLTRQNVPTFPRGEDGFASAEGVARGAYVLLESSNGEPQVILIGTGSEVQLAVQAREMLENDGIPTRVVSMPCQEWFAEQDEEYREQVLPSAVRARVSVEAGIAMSWHRIVGDAGRTVSLEHYGASAAYETLYEEFGLTSRAVMLAARQSIAAVSGDAPTPTTPAAPTASKAGDQL
jgi:transketolase